MGSGQNVVSRWITVVMFCYIWVAANSVDGQSEDMTFAVGPYNVGAPAQGPSIYSSPQTRGDANAQRSAFSVIEFGAKGDGVTDDSDAFMKAWKAACGVGGSVLTVPVKGVAYLLKYCIFTGPCKGSIKLQIDGKLKAHPKESPNPEYWIMFQNVNDLTVSGTGTFDGSGEWTWKSMNDGDIEGSEVIQAPTSIKFFQVTNALLQGITSSNSKMFHINVHQSHHITIKDVHISAPGNSPNTDGIHIGESNNINIIHSFIGTGDDCISIVGGSKYINISDVQCGPGHGISIGSLGEPSIREEHPVAAISVKNCRLIGTTNGLRIKTYASSPAKSSASDITYSDITMTNVANPIIIDQHYCPHNLCQKGGESNIAISNVKYIRVQGTAKSSLGIDLACSKTTPCRGIEFSGVKLTINGQPTVGSCSNAEYKFLTAGQVPSKCQPHVQKLTS